MEEVLKVLKSQHIEFVICGSLALYYHNLIDEYNSKEIDIIVDTPWEVLSKVSNDIKYSPITQFECSGAGYFINGVFIDIYNKQLPEYDEVTLFGLEVKVKTLSELKNYYLSLNLDKLGGHERFKSKMKTRVDLFK
jgi:hypothetical protein